MPRRFALTTEQRERLYERIREDPSFREALKENWRKALGSVEIDPRELEGKELTRSELVPVTSGAARAGITIVIIITAARGLDEIRLEDSVVFEKDT
jgi:hypothetical protein